MNLFLSILTLAAAAEPSPPGQSTGRLNLFQNLFLLTFGGLLLLLAIRRLRTYRLKERYALLFLLIGLPFVGLAFWPEGVAWVANKVLGIQYNTFALICVSVFLFLVVFELLTIVSVQDQKITALAQLVAILMEKQKLAEPEHRPGNADATAAVQE